MISKKVFVLLVILNLFLFTLNAQNENQEDGENVQVPQGGNKIDAILPSLDSSIIFIEGEEAVSTNFNREPILNYSSSGYRTLQLNQFNSLQEGSSYNSDYVFYVEEDGIYELWYGGTPAGHKDESMASYASPFRYVLDGIYIEDIYREDIEVVEEYAPAYYWNYVKNVSLGKGEHRIKIEILERRSHDNKFYFYLDNFFFVKQENGQRVLRGKIPEVFPKNMDDRSIDSSFLTIEDYELLIRDNPNDFKNYVYIAKIYSLIGDYLNALKYLRKASFLDPDNPEVMLLTAKNLIWKGSFRDGLEMYKDLLTIVPERIDLWTEAGKIAGWVGLYYDSIDFFKGGLKNLPDDFSLMANLGITNLWLGNLREAEKQFEKIALISGVDLKMNLDLAEVFRINGYADKAVPIYTDMINKNPQVLQLYLDLEETYIENDQREKIDSLRDLTANTFNSSPQLNKIVQTFYGTQKMKEKVISNYEEQLRNDPNNLTLRKTLAEIYFWNGYKKNAIGEYRNILTNHTYLNILKTETDSNRFLELLDRNYVLSHYISSIPEFINTNQRALANELKVYRKVSSEFENIKKKNELAIANGNAPNDETQALAEEAMGTSENLLAALIYKNESYIEKFNNISSQFINEKENLQKLIEEEKISTEAFEQLLEGTDWNWDKKTMIDELTSVKKDGVLLGNFVLGKIAQLEGNLKEAESNFDEMDLNVASLKGAPFALYETKLWLGKYDESSEIYEKYTDEIDKHCTYISYLTDYLDYLAPEDEELLGYLTEDPLLSINKIIGDYRKLKNDSLSIDKAIKENITSISETIVTKMEQGFYNLAYNTYLLRNELGDFYNNEKMYKQGISQFKQVLAIDPWNLSAKFKLAQVYHLNGDWSEALKIYKEVYEEDPQYNNVASFYNELTRDFADSLQFSGKTFADVSALKFNSSLVYNVNFGKNLAMTFDYNIEHNRIYAVLSPSAGSKTYFYQDVSRFLYQNVNLSLPISLSIIKIAPIVGLYVKSDLIDNIGANVTVNNPGILELMKGNSFYFRGGGALSLNTGSLYLSGEYLYDWQIDSFHLGRTATPYHSAIVNMSLNLFKTKVPVLENTVISLSANGKLMSDNNITWFASVAIANNVPLVRVPALDLNIMADFYFEDALKTSSNYWTPEESLKTGVTLGFTLAPQVNDKVTIVEQFWFNTDFFSNGSDNTKGLSFEIGNRLEYINNDFTTYLNIMGTFDKQLAPAKDYIKYWSLIIEVGVNALFPDYLKP